MKKIFLSLFLMSCVTEPKPVADKPITAAAGGTIATYGAIRVANSGKCLDISGSSTADFAKVQAWDCNGSGAQSFRFNDVGDGWFEIQNTNANKCLDAQGGSAAPGTPFVLYRCSGPVGHNQHFRIDGNMLRVRHSNLCLDANGWGTANGTPFIQWNCGAGQANQQFTFNGGGVAPPPVVNPPPSGNGWRLVWSDEFSGNGDVDRSKWNYEVWRPGTVNNELQAYTDNRRENVRVESGHLVIEARRDFVGGGEYSSGRLKTQGKVSWQYGKFEARIKFPGGVGTWPAFWMMPDDQSGGWPTCGEIDIAEEVGFNPDEVRGTTHTQRFSGAAGRTGGRYIGGLTNDYHVFGIEWYADRIDWFVDGQKYFTQPNTGGNDVYPFHKRYHLILNLAVGGAWGGAQGVPNNIYPRQMLVDWVHVFQR